MHAVALLGEDDPRLPACKEIRNPSVCTSSLLTRTPSPQEFDSDENDAAVIVEAPSVPQSKPKRMTSLRKKAAGLRRRATIDLNAFSRGGGSNKPSSGGLSAADLSALKGLKSSVTSDASGSGENGVLDNMKKIPSRSDFSHQSAHPTNLTNLVEDDDGIPRRNSFCRHDLTESFHDPAGGGRAPSAKDIAAILNANALRNSTSDDDGLPGFRDSFSSVGSGTGGGPNRRASFASVAEGDDDYESFQENELDDKMSSEKLLEELGDCPTEAEMTNLAAIRAREYITELFGHHLPSIDKDKWGEITEFTKDELLVGQHLGKGSFSDVFEVIATVAEEQKHTRESLGADKDELDRLVMQKFSPGARAVVEEEEEEEEEEGAGGLDPVSLAALQGLRRTSKESSDDDSDDDMVGDIDKMMSKDKSDKSGGSYDAMDAQIDAMFSGPNAKQGLSSSSFEPDHATLNSPKTKPSDDDDEDDDHDEEDDFNPCPSKLQIPPVRRSAKLESFNRNELPGGNIPPRRQMSISAGGGPRRRATLNLSNPASLSASLSRPGKRAERKLTLAMKCLRPQIRSNAEQFLIGVEDLVHETAMLASLDHPHIVKLYGRAGSKQGRSDCDMSDMSKSIYDSFKLSDGYFILLDRLKDTLDDRIGRWKKTQGKSSNPNISQAKSAMAVADALAYLHSLNIVFRDLKPANVGFDSMGVLKLFDFGFAVGIDEPHKNADGSVSSADSDDGLLYEKCGTPRYMAPEVGLGLGYSLPCDVYSFGILLWEICSLTKPFAKVKSAAEFHKVVFEKGTRPKIGKSWPQPLRDLIVSCWDETVDDRPSMAHCKTILSAQVRELQNNPVNGKGGNKLRDSMLRRFTG